MLQSFEISVQHVPADVVQHHIFSLLSLSSLISTSMVCRKWRAIASNYHLVTKIKSQKQILLSLFEDGTSIEFLQWFEQRLGYPLFNDNNNNIMKCISLAAEGSKHYGNINLSFIVCFPLRWSLAHPTVCTCTWVQMEISSGLFR